MIESDLIQLRVIEKHDLALLHSWFNDPALRGMNDISTPLTVPQMESKIKNWQQQKDRLNFLIKEKQGSSILGKISINKVHSGIDLIIPLKDEIHENAAREAIHLGVKYLFFENTNKNQMSIWIPSWFDWLIEIVRRIGMKSAGRLRRTGIRNGRYYDLVIFDLLRTEYQDCKW